MINAQVFTTHELTEAVNEARTRVNDAQNILERAKKTLDHEKSIMSALIEEQRKTYVTQCQSWEQHLELPPSVVFDQAWSIWCDEHALSSDAGWCDIVQQRVVQVALDVRDPVLCLQQKQALLQALPFIKHRTHSFDIQPHKTISVMVDYILNQFSSYELLVDHPDRACFIIQHSHISNNSSLKKFDAFEHAWMYIEQSLWLNNHQERSVTQCFHEIYLFES